jgi:hypothetical protein
MPVPNPKRHRPRRSRCAEASLRAEIERIEQMSIEERIKEALSIRKRFSWLQSPGRQD